MSRKQTELGKRKEQLVAKNTKEMVILLVFERREEESVSLWYLWWFQRGQRKNIGKILAIDFG